MKVKLTKAGFDVGGHISPPRFGNLPQGHEFVLTVRDELGEHEGKVRARRMLKRSHPAENDLEWTAEIVESGSERTASAPTVGGR